MAKLMVMIDLPDVSFKTLDRVIKSGFPLPGIIPHLPCPSMGGKEVDVAKRFLNDQGGFIRFELIGARP